MSDSNDKIISPKPDEYSLSIKVTPAIEFAPAVENTANSDVIPISESTLTEEYSLTVEPNYYPPNESRPPQPLPPDVVSNQSSPFRLPELVQPAYYPNNIQNAIPFPYAGLTNTMMQQANNQVLKGTIDINLSLAKSQTLFKEKLRQNQILDLYKDSRKKVVGLQQGDETAIAGSLDWKRLEDSFAVKYAITKIRVQGKVDWKYAFLERDDNRHIVVDSTYLKDEYLAYIDEQIADSINFPQGLFNRSAQSLLHKIPRLEKSNLILLQPQQVMMNNGFLDVQAWEFTPVYPEQRHKFFTLFSLDIDFNPTIQNSDAFDALLWDSLGSQEAVDLAYEQIGAILTPVTTIKKIFAFQGKSQGGKTRLSNIITQLMPADDTKILNSLSEISEDKSLDTPVRLVYVKEVGKNKLSAKQIVKLKAFADGSNLREANSFKILLNTNYPIVTGDNSALEPALANRLSVLPFPKAMDNINPAVASFEDVFFEREKPAIILKALLAFSNVLNNKNLFSSQFEPNVCFEDDRQQISFSLSDSERQNFSAALKTLENRAQPSLASLFDQIFLVTENVNPDMTTDSIFLAINQISPHSLKNPASTGKLLSHHFGNKLISGRNNKGKTCYNLTFSDLS